LNRISFAVALIFSGAILSAGCTEGYPKGNEEDQLTLTMDVRESLDVMNQLARETASWEIYEFSLNPDCVMTIDRQRWWGWNSLIQVDLKTVAFEVRKNGSMFDLVASRPNAVNDQVVIEALPRFVGQNGIWVLKYMARICEDFKF
jgi:hypothetical protein